MEVKVWYEGMPRVVCGVTDSTTCHDVILALASATGHTGRYTLVERWRSGESERNMAPQECPIAALEKYGEYASEVQFVLRRLPPSGTSEEAKPLSQASNVPQLINGGVESIAGLPGRHAGIRRSLTISSGMTGGPGHQSHHHQPPHHTQHPQHPLSPQSQPLNGKAGTPTVSGGGAGGGHVPPECSPAELSRKLQDHLVYQEQEIEFNRIKLAELDKELAALELACMECSELEARLSHQSSELQELNKVDWSSALSSERQLSVRLKSERAEWERRIRDTEANLDESRRRLERLETELVIERERQLAYLDAANQSKKSELARLESELNSMTLATAGGSPLLMRRTNLASSVAAQRPASAQGATAPGLWV